MNQINQTSVSLQQSPPVESTPAVSFPRRPRILIIGVVVVLVLVLVGIGVYWWQKGKLPGGNIVCTLEAEQCPDGSYVGRVGPNCEFTPCPTSTPDPTANWETYTNEKYGYEIEYPESSQITEYDVDQSTPDLLSTLSIEVKETDKQPITEWIEVWENQGVKVSDSATRDRWCELLQGKLTGQLDCNYNAKLPEVQINGLKAFKAGGGRDNSYVEVFYIPHDNYIYQIGIVKFTGDPNSPIKYPVSDQILSTFKFLPASPTGGPETTPTSGGTRVCIQVITPAKNSETGECRQFPTPCDVPDGWEKVGSCPAS